MCMEQWWKESSKQLLVTDPRRAEHEEVKLLQVAAESTLFYCFEHVNFLRDLSVFNSSNE